ncbi:hypothetical protein [uncultured Moraxella sp.]|uniref:hypothetical protein n=1 Tax=uncultured Moraxella sp. TaxID=263769 RepID=UPI0025D28727|nr:hypothetical protein [uncultured Moraxella sp.]
MQVRGLFTLSILYFIAEIYLNFSIYQQMSFLSTPVHLEILEHQGKIIAGIGLALLLTRMYIAFRIKNLQARHIAQSTINAKTPFLKLLCVCIPISFFVQNQVINYIINQATPENKNTAMLITAVHSTFVPHYTGDNAINVHSEIKPSLLQKTFFPFVDIGNDDFSYQNFSQNASAYKKGAVSCDKSNYYATPGIQRAFQPFIQLSKQSDFRKNEKLHIDHIHAFYYCLLNSEEYLQYHSKQGKSGKQMLKDAFKEYQSASQKFQKSTRYLVSWRLDRAHREWRTQMDNKFRFSTTIKPGLNFKQFVNHPDVRRYYLNEAGDKKAQYPFDKNYDIIHKQQYNTLISNKVLPYYQHLNGKRNMTADQHIIDEHGRQAYKAIIMPMIGFWVSFIVLSLNILILFYGFLTRFSGTFIGAIETCGFLLCIISLFVWKIPKSEPNEHPNIFMKLTYYPSSVITRYYDDIIHQNEKDVYWNQSESDRYHQYK